jgi:hypothetical protein
MRNAPSITWYTELEVRPFSDQRAASPSLRATSRFPGFIALHIALRACSVVTDCGCSGLHARLGLVHWPCGAAVGCAFPKGSALPGSAAGSMLVAEAPPLMDAVQTARSGAMVANTCLGYGRLLVDQSLQSSEPETARSNLQSGFRANSWNFLQSL